MKKSIIVMPLIFVAVIVIYGIRYMQTPVRTETAVMINYEETVRGDAFIVRSETVHAAPTNGTFYAYAVDGNRVGKNRRIASVYEGSVNTDTLQELNNIDKKIEILQVQASTKQIEMSDSVSAESKIAERMDSIIDAVYEGNIADIAGYKEEIKIIRSGSGDSVESTSELDELKQKREELENKIGRSRMDIFSQDSGVFTASIDGYEDKLVPTQLKDFTVTDFDNLPVPEKAQEKTSVSSGEKICKVVDNNVWYAVVKVEAKSFPEEYEKGDRVKVRFDSLPSSEVDATIYTISPEEDGYVLISVRCDEYLEGIFSARYSGAEIILKSYQGFKVPVYAIRVEEGQQGIEVQEGAGSIFKPCEIVYTNEEEDFVIIKSPEDAKTPIEAKDIILTGEK